MRQGSRAGRRCTRRSSPRPAMRLPERIAGAKKRHHDEVPMSNAYDKSKLPSRHVSVGPERAPHRSYYYAMGLTEEEIGRPFVGVVSAGNDSAPCNTTLDAQADACRGGVVAGGGTPRRFNTITVTD